jgi:hypothetical protein
MGNILTAPALLWHHFGPVMLPLGKEERIRVVGGVRQYDLAQVSAR